MKAASTRVAPRRDCRVGRQGMARAAVAHGARSEGRHRGGGGGAMAWVQRPRMTAPATAGRAIRAGVRLCALWAMASGAAWAWRLPELFRYAPDTRQGEAYLRQAWQVFRESPAVRQGPSGAPVVVQILFDPDCPFCHRLWVKMQPYRHSAMVIRWVPLAFVRPSTLGKAAAIVTARAPLQALAFDERHFSMARRAGGMLPLYRVAPAIRQAILRNTRLLTRLDSLVPTMLYRDKGRIGILAGVPKASRLAGLMRRLAAQSSETARGARS